MTADRTGLVRRRLLASGLRDDQLLDGGGDLDSYDHDAFGSARHRPGLIVLCESAADVAAAVKACKQTSVPWVARGAGTGLSGGATPAEGGVVVALAGCREIGEVSPSDGLVTVGPGVTNLEVGARSVGRGSSTRPTRRARSCARSAATSRRTRAARTASSTASPSTTFSASTSSLPDGELVTLGGDVPDVPATTCSACSSGSEGTLGAAVRVTVRVLAQAPRRCSTFSPTSPSTTSAGSAVSGIIAAQIVPAAIEMMDALAIEAGRSGGQCRAPARRRGAC